MIEGAKLRIRRILELPCGPPMMGRGRFLCRLTDLYTLLGNEAFADAADPTIGFGTDDGIYGSEATAIHAFMNQTSSLIEEELARLHCRNGGRTVGPPRCAIKQRTPVDTRR